MYRFSIIFCLISSFFAFGQSPGLYFSHGHHGYQWARIDKVDSEFKFCNGTSRLIDSSFIDSGFDTLRFLKINRNILTWGTDTLGILGPHMQPCDSKTLFLGYFEELDVIAASGDTLFSVYDNVKFAGNDSVIFNEKYDRLKFLLWWLSSPQIREYIPESAVYSNRHK